LTRIGGDCVSPCRGTGEAARGTHQLGGKGTDDGGGGVRRPAVCG
jgi:hypothetical protein